MEHLYLENYTDCSQSEIIEDILNNWKLDEEDSNKLKNNLTIIIAYCDRQEYEESAYFLLRDKDNKYYEVYGSHCSCYGFEGQWDPEETNLEYLKSDKYTAHYCYGYDKDKVKRFVNGLLLDIYTEIWISSKSIVF